MYPFEQKINNKTLINEICTSGEFVLGFTVKLILVPDAIGGITTGPLALSMLGGLGHQTLTLEC